MTVYPTLVKGAVTRLHSSEAGEMSIKWYFLAALGAQLGHTVHQGEGGAWATTCVCNAKIHAKHNLNIIHYVVLEKFSIQLNASVATCMITVSTW